jgi:radical SAM superfamily enzyme YgiQ (UPF0313 family)
MGHIQRDGFKVLLVNPVTPPSYWGFQESSWFIGAKAAHIPLPLITIAALLPANWEIRLIDTNVEGLSDGDIAWADAVLMTGMIVQKDGMSEIIGRCRRLAVPIVVGGPFVSSSPQAPELAGASALVIGEAEDGSLLDELTADLQSRSLKPAYTASGKPAMTSSPTPRYDLLRPRAYIAMAIQVSRGCPHGCEFCNVRSLFGRRPRYKSPSQVVAELEAIDATGFRGNVFFVDDNFIGDLRRARLVLEAIASWQAAHGHPFLFYTEADVRLAELTDVIDLMVRAGFFAVFMGFETPSVEALKESSKTQNLKVDAAASACRLRSKGLLVYGGFIVGFDSDDATIFEQVRRLIDDCRIDFAMAGMLTAIPGTPLEARLRREGRLIEGKSNDTFDETNIEPKRMTRLELLRGYRDLLKRLYEPRHFFERAYAALVEWRQGARRRTTVREYLAVLRSVTRQGIFSRYSLHYWRFMLKTLFLHPRKLARAFATAISGHHFFRYTRKVVLPRLVRAERRLLAEGDGNPSAC